MGTCRDSVGALLSSLALAALACSSSNNALVPLADGGGDAPIDDASDAGTAAFDATARETSDADASDDARVDQAIDAPVDGSWCTNDTFGLEAPSVPCADIYMIQTVALWPLDGDGKDYSGHGLDLTVTGLSYVGGRHGSGLKFVGDMTKLASRPSPDQSLLIQRGDLVSTEGRLEGQELRAAASQREG